MVLLPSAKNTSRLHCLPLQVPDLFNAKVSTCDLRAQESPILVPYFLLCLLPSPVPSFVTSFFASFLPRSSPCPLCSTKTSRTRPPASTTRRASAPSSSRSTGPTGDPILLIFSCHPPPHITFVLARRNGGCGKREAGARTRRHVSTRRLVKRCRV